MTVSPQQGAIESSKEMDYLVVACIDVRFRIAGSTLGEFWARPVIRLLRPYQAA